MPRLVLLQYWKLPKSPKVSEIKDRLSSVFSEEEARPISISNPADIHSVAKRVLGRDELPYQLRLEEYFEQPLDWVRIRLGQKDAMRFLRQDWFVHGECIWFASQTPDLILVTEAVRSVIIRQKHLEK